MSEEQTPSSVVRGKGATTEGDKAVGRREFLKLAGIAGAVVGMGGALASLVASCGDEETTTTTAAGETTTTKNAASTTTVSAEAESGREIRVGWVAPLTGALAGFGVPDKYCAERWTEAVEGGVLCGDGMNHPINLIMRDTQSDSNRAAQVAGDLINNDQVDIMMVASAPENTNPVADQCEANGTPCVSAQTPWQAFFFGRNGDPAVGFKWTYHVFVGVEDLLTVYTAFWESVSSNKIIGALWPNDADGNVFRPEFTAVLDTMGYQVVDPGAFQVGTEDYTAQISEFKKAGCDLVTAVMTPPDFTNFWKQAAQQGFRPPIATIAKALLFPQSIEAIGDIGIGITSEVAWHPSFPFTSSLTGETCQELADDFEARTGNQWTIPLLHYIVFEMAVDSLKRTTNVDDKESIIQAVSTIKMDTIEGPVDFTLPVEEGSLRPVPNIYKPPICLGQWIEGTKWPYDLVIVNNAAGEMIPVQAEAELIS